MTWIEAELTEQAHLDQLILDRAAAIEAEAQGLRKREALRQLMASDPKYNALIGSGREEDIMRRNHEFRAAIDRQFPIAMDGTQDDEPPRQTPAHLLHEAGRRIYAEVEGLRIPTYRHIEGSRARQTGQQLTDVQTLPLSFWQR